MRPFAWPRALKTCGHLLAASCLAFGLQVPAGAQGVQAVSLAECQALAEARNPNLAAGALDAKLGEVARLQAQHRFGFTVEAGPTIARSNKPTQATFLTGGVSTLDEWSHDYRLALRQSLVSGGNWGVEVGMGFLESNSQRLDFNPSFRPEVALSLAQPLWRNAWVGVNGLEQARLEAEAAALRLVNLRAQLRLDVAVAYWDWVAARQAQAVRVGSLGATKKVLAFAKAKADAGVLAPAELLQSEAAVAVREAEVLEGEAAVALAADRLWGMLGPVGATRPDGAVVPADLPRFEAHPVALEEAWRVAQAERPDLRLARLELDRQGQVVAAAFKAMQPQLDLRLRASTNNVAAGLVDSVAALPRLGYLDLQAGLVAVWPLGPNPLADAYDIAKLNQEKALAQQAVAEQAAMTEVRLASREALLAVRRVAATRLALRLSEAKLQAERVKLEAGRSNAFQVLSFQSDAQSAALMEARAVVQHLQAQARLARAMGRTP